ncbi:hypothetical protein FQN60_018575 [Etheostoma spectabile]|uniref:Regulator of cell cycle RGCC n=1 Tax=Etheostoma spectabile TaxID=54343 RepID=A0A5J5DIS5_9PERO|nr:hypothetical protein FQN60_018575 [Etheostoma spectabile]
MKSPKLQTQAKLVNEDLSDVLCEFDAVMEDFTSPVEKRHFRYDEHLKTMKRRSSASVSDSGISDSESAESLHRNSFSFSDERLNSPTVLSPATNSPPLMSPKQMRMRLDCEGAGACDREAHSHLGVKP